MGKGSKANIKKLNNINSVNTFDFNEMFNKIDIKELFRIINLLFKVIFLYYLFSRGVYYY